MSKHVEHSKCPFLLQKVLVDLSISFLQIKHLKIGDIIKVIFVKPWLIKFYLNSEKIQLRIKIIFTLIKFRKIKAIKKRPA